MKSSNLNYRFTKQQRKGILALFILIVIVQAAYFVLTATPSNSNAKTEEEQEWLALQPRIDSLKAAKADKQFVIYPFNPNFITDHKGYTLGMSVTQIDRLHKFREGNKYVNSAKEFQQVTKVSDSLLAAISPYFKFPDWVVQKQKEQAQKAAAGGSGQFSTGNSFTNAREKKIEASDINEALEEDLIKVYGIGPTYAKKILRARAKLGAFVSMEQMNDFDFAPETVAGLQKAFYIGNTPDVEKLNINSASLNQLTYFSYFNRDIAKAIITQRSMRGKISNIEELSKINGFPVDKLKIIALYLEF